MQIDPEKKAAILTLVDAARHERDVAECIDAVLDSLSVRERRVLQLRWGLEDGRRRTQAEVSAEFSVSKQRIGQVESKAWRKLCHPSRFRKLAESAAPFLANQPI